MQPAAALPSNAACSRSPHREGKQMQIAMIGVGKMGLQMARHLAAAGHTVVVHDNSRADTGRCGRWC
jgi:NADPH-dependent glutamate synthase beta subunit-like oxidoreductase